MRRSAKAEYACLAVLALAGRSRDARPMTIREIARDQQIPERYLVQILLQLKAHGLVESVRGANGGYLLAKPPGAITLSEVMATIDGPLAAESRPAAVPQSAEAKALAQVWNRVAQTERQILDTTTLAELSEQSAPRLWVI